MKTYYHVTLTENVPKILSEGLIPQIGRFAEDCGEEIPRVYLFSELQDMETALSSWMGIEFENEYGEDVKLTSLQITLSDNFPIGNGEAEYEVYSNITIAPKYIKVFREE